MDITSPKEQKAPVAFLNSQPALFWEMACDLGLQNEKTVQTAFSLLSGGKFLSFLKVVDSWTSQMYKSAAEHSAWNQLAGFYLKFPFNDSSIDRRATARLKFDKSEWKCRRMNQKFRIMRSQNRSTPLLEFLRNWCREVLGPVKLGSIFSRCDFGPGSSVGVHGQEVHFLKKLDHLSVTPSCVPYSIGALLHNQNYMEILCKGDVFCYDAGWAEENMALVRVQHNIITYVPKNAKTDRTIAIEPVLNGFVQKGVDLFLRKRLRRFGYDLSTQKLNQHFAKLGSLHGNLATIDLSAASDSISLELVRTILPPDWFSLLNSIRSPSYIDKTVSDDPCRYEKFCSMGNGFCFPLQTLIFSGCCEYAKTIAHPGSTLVFGDDIIVPQGNALLLFELLSQIGFKPNVDKTFVFGPFRESCGADFYDGINVRPLYFDKEVKHPIDYFPFLNQWSARYGFTSLWHKASALIPKRWFLPTIDRCHVDEALFVPIDVFMISRHARFDRKSRLWRCSVAIRSPVSGMSPRTTADEVAGKLRGNLSFSDSFTKRLTTRIRVRRKSCFTAE